MKRIPATKIIKGLKFLTHGCSTVRDGQEFDYSPAIGKWMKHPTPAKWDGNDCGSGRWHMMLKLSSVYAPKNWVAWRMYGRGVVGYSDEKAGVTETMISPIPQKVWYRYIRRFGSGAVLRGADLSGADLRDAVLRGADLRGADLSYAVLRGADLSGADLRGADLSYAVLRDAVLRDAVLRDAVLRDAVLRDADLSGADSRYVIKNEYTIFPDGYGIGVVTVEELADKIKDLLPAINRIILSDEENKAMLEIAKIVEYPINKK